MESVFREPYKFPAYKFKSRLRSCPSEDLKDHDAAFSLKAAPEGHN